MEPWSPSPNLTQPSEFVGHGHESVLYKLRFKCDFFHKVLDLKDLPLSFEIRFMISEITPCKFESDGLGSQR